MLITVLALAGLLGCSSDDGESADEGPPSTSEAVPATLPDDVEAGSGQLVLDGQAYVLSVRSCALDPVTDPATGVTTEASVDADEQLGLVVSVTRSATEGDLRTVTDTVSVLDADGELVEASRADVGGRYLDLLVEGALGPLLQIEGDLITGEGVFGPPGARPGDPSAVEGSLILRCPPPR